MLHFFFGFSEPYNNKVSQPRLLCPSSACIMATAEAGTGSSPPTEFHCLIFPSPDSEQKGTVALLRVKLAYFRLDEECIESETACQLLWSPLPSALVFTHCVYPVPIQDTTICSIVQDQVAPLFLISASPHAHGQGKLHLLMNTALTQSQIQQYPNCFKATCKALPFPAPKEESSRH